MSSYQPPIKEMVFSLHAVAGLEEVCGQHPFEELTADLADSILTEAGRVAQGVLSPLHGAAEHAPPFIENGQVRLTPGYAEAFAEFAAGGWNACSADPKFGGMGLPQSLSFAVSEMWSAANLSFSICPLLSTGAIEAIDRHASEALKIPYLEALVSGRWTGTMNLTEPQAGTDLAAIRTKAVPEVDHYRIFGNKIFISFGDHGMTDNIVHLVLARIQDAPEGVHGISMFLVPKYLVNEDGSLGERNDLRAVSLEHKLGIHGSPTCAMSYGDEGRGAIGYLVGEENRGLACMFTMMNNARLAVGIQAVGLSEHAYQKAVAFARERVQGTPVGRTEGTIIHHPDVRRMLMLMRSLTEAARAICYATAGAMDRARCGQTHENDRVSLLIPLAKGWSTEVAQEVASLGVQVHGGMGYVEETGAAQIFRDTRITSIYEGTTGIQANDLVGRKVLRDGGSELSRLIAEMRATCEEAATHDQLILAVSELRESADQIEKTLAWLLDLQDDVLSAAASFNFLMGCGTCVGGYMLLRTALAATGLNHEDEDFCLARIGLCNFYSAEVLPRTLAYFRAARSVTEQDYDSMQASLRT